MKKMILIDGFSLLFRAYYATAYTGNLMRNSKGLHTNMLFGFATMMSKLLRENEFSHIMVAFDSGQKTFRHEMFSDYKGTRSETPPELIEQIPYAKKYVDLLGIARYEHAPFEADDIIGTMAKRASEAGYDVDIFTGDKDLLQLVDENITVRINRKGMTDIEDFTPDYVVEKMEITPKQVTDLKGLMGDSSDNIPGIPGVGQKTAVKLLKEYGTLESILEHADDLKGKLGEKVRDNKDLARLCKKLATIIDNGNFDITIPEIEYKGFDVEELNEYYRDVEFRMMIQEKKKKEPMKDILIIDEQSIYDLDKYLKPNSYLSLELFEDNYHNADILGLAIVNEDQIFIPFSVLESTMHNLGAWLSDASIPKKTYDYKQAKVALYWHGYELEGVTFDLLLASYIDNANTKDDLYAICMLHEYSDVLDPRNVLGRGANKQVPATKELAEFAVKNAVAIRELESKLLHKIEHNGQQKLYELELNLAGTLAHMEIDGVTIDLEELKIMRQAYITEIDQLTKRIYELADEEFNINSPKQLGVILFEKLALPYGKKTKTGYSTNVDVLNKLRNYEIVEKVLEYRGLAKLLSTYIDGIDKVVVHRDGVYKVHTIYKQAQTATGRLSSIEPNLQNLPIKTERGREIRKLFIPKAGNTLFGADYSQVELRILAHLSNTDVIMDAFKKGEDIHTATAMKVFHVNENEVTSVMRRQAKAVNFGIIYGQGAWGLSEEIDVTPKEAQEFIDQYYASFPGILHYLNGVVDDAKRDGYVETIYHRRRYLPDLYSSNVNLRNFGERTAKNAVIQGSAADVIKQAMVDIDREIRKRKLKSRLIIQIHDELILDVDPHEKELIEDLVVRMMSEAVILDVPLKVDYGFGKNLYEVK